MTLTNGLGNTHGIVVQENQTVISGGTHSTTMTLADGGATFANGQTGGAVIVSGVANGVAATDAANVGQIAAAVAPLDARLTTVETNVGILDQRISDVESKMSGGVAMATALTQPVSFAPGALNAVTGGVATYNGQSAVAFGFNRLVMNTSKNRLIVSGGFGVTRDGQSTVRVGGSFSW
jgi:autotransporter adhesin